MFKKLVSILLLLALICSNFSRYFVFASFQINKQYIVEKLCENRKRPQLQCNGNCYLMKKLKQAEEREKKQAEKNELNNIEICLLQQAFDLLSAFHLIDIKLSKPSSLYPFIYVGDYIDSIFRPPRTIV